MRTVGRLVPGLGPLESAIMNAVWASRRPLTVSDARKRLDYRAGHGGEPSYSTVMTVMNILWWLLFGIKSPLLNYIMVASVAILIGASLVLILLLEYPFSGTVAVRPTPFERVAADLRSASVTSTSRSGAIPSGFTSGPGRIASLRGAGGFPR